MNEIVWRVETNNGPPADFQDCQPLQESCSSLALTPSTALDVAILVASQPYDAGRDLGKLERAQGRCEHTRHQAQMYV